jgi:tetratricopeptide (TPR) repeat protein
MTFDSIMKNLPENWIPDLVIFKTPQFFPIPINIEGCPFVTIVLLDDWFGSIDYIPDNLSRFDYIFTDRYSVALLNNIGHTNVDYWPCFGFDPSVFRVFRDESKTIDISFTGSFNSNIQARRLTYLHRLCKLPEQHTVRLYYNVWKDEYVKILNRSKIVFNRSIKGEMNMRCFEAPACRALLFIEEENLEVRDFLEPGKECVVYNDANFEKQIEYYLEHEEERCCIAEAGYQKILNYTDAHLYSKLLTAIESKGLVTYRNRKQPHRYTSSTLHRDLLQVNLSLRGRVEDVIPIITSLLQQESVPAIILNDCAVVLLAYIEDREKTFPPEHTQKLYCFCISLLENALKSQIGYVTPQFNLAQIYFTQMNYSQASLCYHQLLQKPTIWDYNDFKGQVFPLHYLFPLRYLWSDALVPVINDDSGMAKGRHTVITYIVCLRLAEIAHACGNYDEGQRWYKKALDILPNHPAASTACVSHMNINSLSGEDQEILTMALTTNPFIIKHWEVYLQILSNSGCYTEALHFAKACLLYLSRVQFSDDSTVAFFKNQLSILRKMISPAEM